MDTENDFNQFIDDFLNPGSENIEGAGLFDKFKQKKTNYKLIFFKTSDVNHWEVFGVDNMAKLIDKIKEQDEQRKKLTTKVIKIIPFVKDDLYKQISGKSYSCFSGDKQVGLIELTSVKIEEGVKSKKQSVESATKKITGSVTEAVGTVSGKIQKTGEQLISGKDNALIDATFASYRPLSVTGKVKFLQMLFTDILEHINDQNYITLLQNKDKIEALQKALAPQSGGVNMADEDDKFDLLEFLTIGGNKKSSEQNIEVGTIDNIENQYKDILNKINEKNKELELDACLVIDEKIIGKDNVEKLYIK